MPGFTWNLDVMKRKRILHCGSLRLKARRKGTFGARDGQTILFIAMSLVILLFAILWIGDVHRIIFVKDKTQNAGDAAALAGARWQATSLNFIGELNLMHAMALAAGDWGAVDVITNTQVRLSFTGPMTGVAAAQQAAKLNNIYVNEAYTEFVREHAAIVRGDYGSILSGVTALPEPWPGAWDEYADMLTALADDGIAAGVDNAWFYDDPVSGHPLLQIEFYEAVAGRDWCWFFRNYPSLLASYTTYTWWPALPAPDPWAMSSSELLGLWAVPQIRRFSMVLSTPGVADEAERLNIDVSVDEEDVKDGRMEIEHVWFYYSMGRWGTWDALNAPFPVDGRVKREYDYVGADSVMRVEAGITRFTSDGGTDAEDVIVWTGAAKPFGFLRGEGGAQRPNAVHLVLPAFRDVRLIPMDASTASSGGSFNLTWRRHCAEHVPRYLDTGPGGVSQCRYCRQLVQWEIPAFREAGVAWLSTNSWQCTISSPGGSPGGGTRRAH